MLCWMTAVQICSRFVTQASHSRVKDRSGGEMRDSVNDSLMRSGAPWPQKPEATWKKSAPFSPR
jgi:hypothetical protein